MPIYEYQCANCGHHMDLMQKMNEPPAEKCPECSENKLVKLVSAAGFQLKGTGWYATDFKNKGVAEKSNKDQKDSTGNTASSTDNKKDSSASKKTRPTKNSEG